MATQFCELVGVEHPVILAPMGGATPPELVAAVSNAGGLGLAPLWRGDAQSVRASIAEIKALTDAPFGVNLNMAFPDMAQLDACLEENVPVISIFWGHAPEFVARARDAGATVIFSAWDAESAVQAVDYGASVICAQGWEAGGHVRGTVSTMALVPAVVDAVVDVPVVAAGGIADGRGLAAALALGASAAWIGTRFLSAQEASIHPQYRARLLAAKETDTGHYDDLFELGWPDAPHRVLKNKTTAMWETAGRPLPGERPGEADVVALSPARGEITRYQCVTPDADVEGDVEATSMWCGQGVSLVRKVQPAADIVRSIVNEAREIIRF